MLVDSHAHLLYFPEDERNIVIKNAHDAGVHTILNISTKVGEIDALLQCAKGNNIFCTVGTHPCNVHEEPHFTCDNLAALATQNSKIVGFGETGLDYYHSTEHKHLQIRQFTQHIIAAASLKMPVIVHTRNADEDTVSILKEYKLQFGESLKIIIHCFTGDAVFCTQLLDIGCYISYSGIVTFKNAKAIKESMLITPMEKMLIETDSPFLAPEPMRGKRNEPAFVKHVAEFIAKEKGLEFTQVCSTTAGTFFKLFGINC